MVQAIVRVVIMRKRYLVAVKKTIVIQCAIRQYLARKEYYRKFQIRAFEDAKKARRIENLRHKIFLRKVMEEKTRQSRLMNKISKNQSRRSTNNILSPQLKRKRAIIVSSKSSSRVNRGKTKRREKIAVTRNDMIDHVKIKASSPKRYFPQTPSNTSRKTPDLWRPTQDGIERQFFVEPPNNNIRSRQFGISPRTHRLYRLYTHTYDIR